MIDAHEVVAVNDVDAQMNGVSNQPNIQSFIFRFADIKVGLVTVNNATVLAT